MKKRILIVDDEKDIREMLAKKLQEEGYLVTMAADSAQALEECTYRPPDVMILDIILPDKDGYALIKELSEKNLLGNTAVIFVTGQDLTFRSLEERVSQLGAFDFLMKPCSMQDLLVKVTNACAQKG
jgi:DNA-binding response OmpR family regulator